MATVGFKGLIAPFYGMCVSGFTCSLEVLRWCAA